MVSIVSDATLKKRKCRNVMDLSGHVSTMVYEVIWTIFVFSIGYYSLKKDAQLWLLMFCYLRYGLLGFSRIAVSSAFRNELQILIMWFANKFKTELEESEISSNFGTY